MECFVKRNNTQIIAQNIVSSAVNNGDGTYTYSFVSAASNYQNGNTVATRFYSYRSGQPGVFTPGPAESVWSPDFVVGSTASADDGNPCTIDACSDGVATHTPVAAGTACDNSTVCDGHETCNASAVCTAGTPLTVDDGNPCTTDVCNPTTGVSHTAVATGTACDNATVCDGHETCNASAVCTAGTPLTVDDGDPCTTDTCNATSGVSHTPIYGGECPSAPESCHPYISTQSNGNLVFAVTLAGVQAYCEIFIKKNNVQTVAQNIVSSAVNNGNGTYTYSFVYAASNYHNGDVIVTRFYSYQSGKPGVFTPGPQETVWSPEFVAGSSSSVDDGNPCTADACSNGIATHTPVATGTACDNSTVCDGHETCNASGVCTSGTPLTVDDGNPCTADACDPVTGVSHTPVSEGTSCGDGDLCTDGDVCNGSGSCVSGTAIVIDDGNPCTTDACDPVTGVSHTPVSEGTSCADDNLCNGDEVCDGEGTCQSGTPPELEEDGDPCTLETCDPATGLVDVHHCAPIDPSVVTTVAQSTEWLYTGSDPIQTGVAPGTIELRRAAVLHGFVHDRSGAPILGVTISVLNHPEFGSTVTQINGAFEMVVNGGGQLTVDYAAAGYLPAQRQIDVRWNNYSTVADAVLVRPDPEVTELDVSGATSGMQVAEGSVVSDERGERLADVMIPDGAQATLALPNGTHQTVDTLHLRLTEYTVGSTGPDAMPAVLPATSGYTYAIDISADEATAAGALSVEFVDPVIFHVDNFLNFPAGTVVPLGSYDRVKGVWVPERSGVVIDLLPTESELAEIDLDGDGVAETSEVLEEHGITLDERQALAVKYPDGGSVWRVEINHFSPHDLNWPLQNPDGAGGPPDPLGGDGGNGNGGNGNGNGGDGNGNGNGNGGDSNGGDGNGGDGNGGDGNGNDSDAGDNGGNGNGGDGDGNGGDGNGPPIPPAGNDPDFGCQGGAGSTLDCHRQTLKEEVGVTGTPFELTYASDRVAGRKKDYAIDLIVRQGALPAPLLGIEIQTEIAGRVIFEHYDDPTLAPTLYHYTWDGLDLFGRLVQGRQPVSVTISYLYHPVYWQADEFIDPAKNPFNFSRISPYIRRLRQRWSSTLGGLRATEIGLGGWTLTPHQVYDPSTHVLYGGDGSRSTASQTSETISVVAGALVTNTHEFDSGYSGDNGPAVGAHIYQPSGIAVAPDGSVYISQSQNHVVRKIDPNGIITTVVGDGTADFSGDNGPAIDARLNAPQGIALGLDESLYIVDNGNHRIRRVRPDGIIETIAGTGAVTLVSNGDGGPATLASFGHDMRGIAVGPSGTLYIADSLRVRRITTAGKISTIVGNGNSAPIVVNGPATASAIGVGGLAVGADETIYIADDLNLRNFKVGPDGILHNLTGSASASNANSYTDGILATTAQVRSGGGIAVDPQGNVFLFGDVNVTPSIPRTGIFTITPDGVISTVQGITRADLAGASLDREGAPATNVHFFTSVYSAVAFGESGLYFSTGPSLRRLKPALPELATGQTTVASPAGDAVYVFDAAGRHLRTLNPLTGATVYEFGYETGSQKLHSVTDAFGNVTTINHDTAGNPTTIVGPYGQTTTLGVDANGYLASIADPLSQTIIATYDDGGLIQSFTDAREQSASMTYDSLGRLLTDTNRDGALQTLTPVNPTRRDLAAEHTDAEGHVTRYAIHTPATGGANWVNTFPDGTQATSNRSPGGLTQVVLPSGMISTSQINPDPRFGIASPLLTTTQITPSGLTRTETNTRTTDLTDPDDPFSIDTQTTERTINGNTWTSVYDGSLLKRVDTSPEGRTTTTVLDANGMVLSQQRGALTPIEFAYDEHGRLHTITQGTRVTTNSYYASGETKGYLQAITNALSQTTTFTPDALGHVLSQVEPGDVETQFTWDENSNLSSVTPPGKPTHVQTYTPVDQLETYVPPVLDDVPTPQTTYTYNTNHQLTSMVRPDGVTLTQSYDTAGRLSLITMPTGTILHEYYGATPCTGCTPGSLMRLTGPGSNTLDFTYDGSLLSSTTWSGAINGAVQWTHDNDFRIATETVVPSGDTITYRYDNDGLTTCASKASCTPPSTDALKLTYSSSSGLLTGTAIGNLTEAFTYNALGELATHTASYSGTPIYSGTFHSTGAPRDELGRIKRKVETVLGTTRTDEYEYDDRGRLFNVARNSTLVAEYDYDANGNRLSLTNPDTSSVTLGGYDDQDRMLTYGSFEYTYNANGDLVSKTNTSTSDTTTYEYDARGALINAVLPDGTNIDYVIDGQSRRIQKLVNGTPVQGFLYKDQLKISAELDGLGNLVAQFVYVGPSHSPDFMIKGGNVYRFIKDQLGSPRLVIDVMTGDVAQQIEYDEFGNVLNDTAPGFQPFGFSGGVYDQDTGLVRFGARDYDPMTGRWTTKDPVGWNGGDTDLYVYMSGDPVNGVDPSGEIHPLNVIMCSIYQFLAADAIADCQSQVDTNWHSDDPNDWCKLPGGSPSDQYWNCLRNNHSNAVNGLLKWCTSLAFGAASQSNNGIVQPAINVINSPNPVPSIQP